MQQFMDVSVIACAASNVDCTVLHVCLAPVAANSMASEPPDFGGADEAHLGREDV